MRQWLALGLLLTFVVALSAASVEQSNELIASAEPVDATVVALVDASASGSKDTSAQVKALKQQLKQAKQARKTFKKQRKSLKKENKSLKSKKDAASKKKLQSNKKALKDLKKAIKTNKKDIKKLKKQIRKARKGARKGKKSQKKKARKGKKSQKKKAKRAKKIQKKLKKLQKKLKKLVKKLRKAKSKGGKKGGKKSKKLQKKIKKLGAKICKLLKKLGKKCPKKGALKKKLSKKFKGFRGKKLNQKQAAKLEKRLKKKQKALAKWQDRRSRLLVEIGKNTPTSRQKRRMKKQEKKINKLKKQISKIMKLLGKREGGLSLANSDPARKANADRAAAKEALQTLVTSEKGKQALTDFDQAAERLVQQKMDELEKAQKEREIQLKAIVDKQRADSKIAEANKKAETAFDDKAKAKVAELKAEAADLDKRAKGESAVASKSGVKAAEENAAAIKQTIADKNALAKSVEVLRTSVAPAGREVLNKMEKAQEVAIAELNKKIDFAKSTPTFPATASAKDKEKNDPNGAFKKNDPNGVTAHEALMRIAKMHEDNKLVDFSTSQMENLLGVVAEEPVIPDL